MFNGMKKAVTFSYDDSIIQDKRLIEIFDKYGLRATFNLNSGFLGKEDYLIREGVKVSHIKWKPEEISEVYKNHEIAAHTLTHPTLPELPDDEVVRQVEEDRLALERLSGRSVVGLAYPCGGKNFDERVVDLIRKHTGIKYARTIISTHNFDLQSDLLRFRPTVYHHQEWDKMFELGEEFIKMNPDTPKLFYIWGHSFEFDIHDTWDRFEEFCKMISGRNDIFYGTNRECFGL